MSVFDQHVIFTLDEQLFALRLSAVERILRVAEVTPLPDGPEIVLGLVNVQGQIIAVLDVRKRFRLPEREINLSDRLIIARTAKRRVALLADTVSGVLENLEHKGTAMERILPRIEYVEGVAELEDGLVLVHDLDKFLSLEEEQALNDAVRM